MEESAGFVEAHVGASPSGDMFSANGAHSCHPGASPQDAGGVTTRAESAIQSGNDKTRDEMNRAFSACASGTT